MGNTLTWKGRELQSFGSLSFTYDMNGMRSSKGSTDYLYSGTTLIRESNSTNTIYYLYGQSGLIGFELDGVSYYYVRNLLGDVTGVIDNIGNLVVQYTYDSWGKVLSTTGSMANTVGTLNPIRYHGYYYDVETGLYYLQSRYYDPETGRFISPDVIAEGGNLYTYCLNDPVNRSDESGYLSRRDKNIIKVAIGVVATVAAVAITVATGGAALPVIAGVAASTLIGAGISAGITALQGGSEEEIFESAVDGAIDGFMWGGISAFASASIGAIKGGLAGTKAVANISNNATKIKPDIGNKVEYAFGNVQGSGHNMIRSAENAKQLSGIGIHDNASGRKILTEHFTKTFYTYQENIMGNSARTSINTLIAGPGGFRGVNSIWEGNKLITFIFFGG